MGIRQVTLFGGVRITHNHWLTEVKLAREIQALQPYPRLQSYRFLPKEMLAGVFWTEHSQLMSNCLHTASAKLSKDVV